MFYVHLFLFVNSIATCLGARTVAAKALEWTQNHKVLNHVCSDEEAVLACERFAGKQISFVFPDKFQIKGKVSIKNSNGQEI